MKIKILICHSRGTQASVTVDAPSVKHIEKLLEASLSGYDNSPVVLSGEKGCSILPKGFLRGSITHITQVVE